MLLFIIGLILGLFIGVFLGITYTALMAEMKEEEERYE